MRSKNTIVLLFAIFSGAMVAVGRLYDSRLEIFDINFSVLLSLLYSILVFYMILLIKRSNMTLIKILQYSLFLFIIIFNLILWIIYDFNDYGLEKFTSFILITIPISIIISEIMQRKHIGVFMLVLFSVSLLLLVLSLVFINQLSVERSGVMGGGPIVLSRWLCLGALISFFHPKLKRYRILLFPLFLIISLFAGSRGPIIAVIITFLLFSFLNFKSVFLKILIICSLLTSIIFFSGIGDKLVEIKTVSRVFMNIEEGSIFQSTEGRFFRLENSLEMITLDPFGVGLGNWASRSNQFSNHHFLQNDYPHNIILEIFCELGFIVGLMFIFYLFITFLKSFSLMIKNNKSSFHQLSFYIFAFLFLNSMISGDLSDSRLLFIIMSLFSIKDIHHANNL